MGILCFRRTVPQRLRAIIGKREILVSFKTTDLAKALPQYRDSAAETEAALKRAEAARKAAPPQSTVPGLAGITPRSAMAAAERWRREMDAKRQGLDRRWQAQEREFRRAREQKDAFSIDELNRIFQAPIFTGCASEIDWARPGAASLLQILGAADQLVRRHALGRNLPTEEGPCASARGRGLFRVDAGAQTED